MKILDILVKENFDFAEPRAATTVQQSPLLSVSDLNSLQVRTLKRLRDGVIDMDTVSDKEFDIVMDLIDMGLVDSDGNVTVSGTDVSDKPVATRTAIGGEDDELSVDGVDDGENDLEDTIDFDIGKTRSTDY